MKYKAKLSKCPYLQTHGNKCIHKNSGCKHCIYKNDVNKCKMYLEWFNLKKSLRMANKCLYGDDKW